MNTYKRCNRMRLIPLLFFVFGMKLYSQEIPQLDSLVLNNGLKVYLLQYGKNEFLNVKLVINGGKKNETACKVGYSEIIQRLMSESLNEKQGLAIKKENRAGCEIINGQTILQVNCSGNDLNRQIELFCMTICRLSFTREKMDRIVSAISDDHDPVNMSALCLSQLFKDLLLYTSKSPLGRHYCQYQLQKVLPEELRNFYIENYTPARSSVLICGNFNVNEVKKTLSKQFVKWRSFHKEENITKTIDLKLPKIKNKEIVFINKQESENYTLHWIKSAPSPGSPDHTAFLVACELFNTILAKKIKDEQHLDTLKFKPLSYSNDIIETSCISSQNNMIDVIGLLDTALLNFYNLKFTQNNVEESIKKLKDVFLKTNDPETILSFYDPLMYDFKVRTNYLTALSGVGFARVQMIVKKYFDPGLYKLIIVGKEHLVSKQLDQLKNVTKYAASGFETCDDACKEVVIFKCHCESCYKRGYCNIWRFDPSQKNAIKSARAKAK